MKSTGKQAAAAETAKSDDQVESIIGEFAGQFGEEDDSEAETESVADDADGEEEEESPDPDSKPADEEPSKKSDEDGSESEGDEDEDDDEKKKGKPKATEWAQLRRAKRKLAERERAMVARVDDLANQAASRLAPMQRMLDAMKAGDWDAFASEAGKASGEDVSDWKGLNTLILKRVASPEHGLLQQLKREREETARAKAEREAQERQAAAAKAAEAHRKEYLDELRGELEALGGEFEGAAEVPDFVQAVYAEQSRAYDNATGTTISARKAAERALKKARDTYTRLAKLFGDQAPNPERQPSAKPTSRNPRTVPSRRAVQASSGGDFRNAREAIAWAERELKAARD